MKHTPLFYLLFVWLLNSALAQPNYAPPSGVWCSCPPTTGVGNGSVDPAVAVKPYVQGILVRVVWKDMEASDDVYNWSLIDDQISAAKSYGKKISLAVGGGLNSPNWIYSLGVQSISYTVPFTGTIPIPWDTLFLTKWTNFITQLGNRYAQDTTIQLVYITNSSTNGFEMQLPFNPTPTYDSIGYTDQKVIDSWKQVMDAFNNAFPNHYLTNDFHPVNTSNAVADSVYAYANTQIVNRYGANAWWWTQNNTTVYPAQYALLQNSSATHVFTGIQMAYSGVNNPGSFGTGGMPAALELAITNNICYWEIWNTDITDGSFDSLLSNATCLPATGINELLKSDNDMVVFPNPAQHQITISLKKSLIIELELTNELGKKIVQKMDINNHQYQLDLDTPGMYFLKITDNKKNIHYRKILLRR